MELNEDAISNIELILQSLSDVFGVGIILTDENGQSLTKWQYPNHATDLIAEIEEIRKKILIKNIEFDETGFGILKYGDGKRRFVIRISELSEESVFVQSEDLPEHFAWIDGNLKPQVSSEGNFHITLQPKFLLSLFITNIFQILNEEHRISLVNDLDIENIRRIGVCLRKKIICENDRYDPGPFSLAGVPSIEAFFNTGLSLGSTKGFPYIQKAFKLITESAKANGSFNLMALSADFILKGTEYNKFCRNIIRKYFGNGCFDSDIRCLLKSALSKKNNGDIVQVFEEKCPAGFTELISPIFTDGLIVGVVFAGQLISNSKDSDNILKYINQKKEEIKENYCKPKPDGKNEILRTKKLVAGLAALIEMMFERACMAENAATMGKVLTELRLNKPNEAFYSVCSVIKRLLAASHCSVFILDEDNRLVLRGTTAHVLSVRESQNKEYKKINANQALNRIYYLPGEGLTGSIFYSKKPRFEPDGTQAENWMGKCNEDNGRSQVFLAPIITGGKLYGVLRVIRPARYGAFLHAHQTLISRFAEELAIVMQNYDLTQVEAVNFKKESERWQTLLAVAAHEYKGPLHNVLSLSTAIRYTWNRTELENLHQAMKEEVYRAKRIMDNYLLQGVMGREEMKYNFKLNNLCDLITECASRFIQAAARKGQKIEIGSVRQLPEINFDHDRLDQVFSNLIENAIKYGFNSTTIRIDMKVKEKNVTVAIEDMGLGIPKENRKDIFQGYQRAVEDKTRFKPGTGLGLMIAQKIVSEHSGSIYVESEPIWSDPKKLALNEGYITKFIVSLPKR